MGMVVPLARARTIERFGGKAAQLAALTDVSIARVPEGFAISCEAFRQILEGLPRAQWPERLLAGPANERRGDRLAAIRDRIVALPFPRDTWAEIVAAYRSLGNGPVAVRSSALHEDTQGTSA